MFIRIRRLIAAYIDLFLITYLSSLFVELLNIFDNLFYIIFINTVGIVLIMNILIRKDCIFGYTSIGKQIMFLNIYLNGEKVRNKELLKKRVSATLIIFPLYPFSVLFSKKSRGDIIYNTEVK